MKPIQLSAPRDALWIDGREALAFTFLLACTHVAWNHAVEGDMWNAVETAFHPRMRRRLFHASGVPRAFIRNETERVCSRLGIRHLFGREGEQSWLRTVFFSSVLLAPVGIGCRSGCARGRHFPWPSESYWNRPQ
jgi:hypothetical protein